MKGRVALAAGLLALAGVPAFAAERSPSLRLQELEAKLADAEQRAAFEAAERQKLDAALASVRGKAAAVEAERERERRRADDLDQRLRAMGEREAALRAELDLSSRTRSAVEDQRSQCRSELEAMRGKRQAELDQRDGQLEDCRGRVADLEAHNGLLVAEKRGLEREKQEKAEEIAGTYEALVASAKRDLAAAQGRVMELEAAAVPPDVLGRLQERDRAEEAERAKRLEDATRLRGQLVEVLKDDIAKGRAALAETEGRVAVAIGIEALFGAKPGEVKPAGREILKRLAGVVRGEARAVVVQVFAPAPAAAEGAKKSPNPWETSSSVRIARLLQEDGGIDRQRIVVVGAASGAGQPAAGAGPLAVIDLVPAATLGAALPSLQLPDGE